MKAFRSMPYPCIGPSYVEIYLSLNHFSPLFYDCCRIQNADPIYNLYNDVLYKIEKLSFTKDSLEKKKYQISEY